MTPEEWRRVNELFESAVRLDADARDSWLEQACGRDDRLRAEVDRLLAHDERVNRDLFLRPPEGPRPNHNRAAFNPAPRATQGAAFELETVDLRGGVGSSRVDLQACKLEYSIVSPK